MAVIRKCRWVERELPGLPRRGVKLCVAQQGVPALLPVVLRGCQRCVLLRVRCCIAGLGVLARLRPLPRAQDVHLQACWWSKIFQQLLPYAFCDNLTNRADAHMSAFLGR